MYAGSKIQRKQEFISHYQQQTRLLGQAFESIDEKNNVAATETMIRSLIATDPELTKYRFQADTVEWKEDQLIVAHFIPNPEGKKSF